ncbi:RICIN domain-containing protein [Streptomyces massasporeus]|uniref:RICIN domain-containing protein n=1 Tax=Streptomyces massasporeus TaxID=67324 RepID=UPI0038193416
MQQWTCLSGNTNQHWQFLPTTDGHVRVVSRNATTAAWDVTGGSGATRGRRQDTALDLRRGGDQAVASGQQG